MRKYLFKTLSIALIATFIATPVMASTSSYTHYDSVKVFDASQADEIESKLMMQRDQIKSVTEEQASEIVTPEGVDPGYGATRLIMDPWSSGYTYEDDIESGTASVIWNNLLTILSYFTKTAGGVILDAASIYSDSVDKSKGSQSKLLHSYYYPDKVIQVWDTTNSWKTYYTSRNREWYRHQFASYVNSSNITRTNTSDYTKDLGYSSIHIDSAPHYSNDTWLLNEAYYRWANYLPPVVETW